MAQFMQSVKHHKSSSMIYVAGWTQVVHNCMVDIPLYTLSAVPLFTV